MLKIVENLWVGLRPKPRWGAHRAPPHPLAGGEGGCCPSPRTPPPLSAFGRSVLPPMRNLVRPWQRSKQNSNFSPPAPVCDMKCIKLEGVESLRNHHCPCKFFVYNSTLPVTLSMHQKRPNCGYGRILWVSTNFVEIYGALLRVKFCSDR